MPLKKQIEKIAAGVKGYCYLATENPHQFNIYMYRDITLKQELNDYIITKFNYDFNSLNAYGHSYSLMLYGNREERINRILQEVLYSDREFWESHKDFNVLTFVEVISDVNDLRHAEKIMDYIFTEISKTQFGKGIIEKSLPLVFFGKAELLYGLEERTFRFTFDRFGNYCNLQTLSKDKLCYPFSAVSGVEVKLRQGKQLAEEFLQKIYPEDVARILEILKTEIDTPSAAFSGNKQALCNVNGEIVLSVENRDEWTIRHIFDYPTFGYHDKIVDREAVAIYCPEYFSSENVWNRFYLKAFYMFKLVKNKSICFANLFEVYYDLFQFIEENTGIKTSYQRNVEGRDEKYAELKSVLAQYGLNISDKYKSDYIISLLDRKVAIREESERFPIFEQLGDAVYGLAVAEILFYNPHVERMAETFEDFIGAKKQIKMAEKLGIDKLYLSAYSLPRKYERDILINPDTESYILQQEREQLENDKKYLADSLEMIIGTICKEFGYKIALEFTKNLLREAYPANIMFMSELHWEDRHITNIERDYWTRILPAPYSRLDHSQDVLWRAFDKFFKAYVLGTEDVEVRRFITNSFRDNGLYDNIDASYEVNQVFYEYLHKGLESAVEKYGNSVKEKYKKLEK